MLDGRRIGILGFGLEGRAALGWLRLNAPAATPVVFDEGAPTGFPTDVEFHQGDFAGAPLADCDVLIRSPGISLYRPFLEQARAAGVTVTTGSSLWLEAPRTCSVVAVTGTKGKSTVSALTAHLVEAAGRRVALAGNIGVPLIEVEGNAVDVTVAELSSYQVADLVGNVDLAVLTNLFPEHLDWHGGEDSYYRDKTRLLALAAGKAFVNGRCERSLASTRGLAQRQLFGSAPGWEVSPAGVFVHGDQVAGRPSWPLRGAHNDVNLAAALAAVNALGLDPLPLLPALADFRGLAHRQQRV
ncbi:MAG: Mur ligase family protein, partial [Pseudomonadota bacterium]